MSPPFRIIYKMYGEIYIYIYMGVYVRSLPLFPSLSEL